MTSYIGAKCDKCGQEFTASGGDGFYFSIFKCEDCGKTKRIDHSGVRAYQAALTKEQLGKCLECGGIVSKKAKDRCPKCKSEFITLDKGSTYIC